MSYGMAGALQAAIYDTLINDEIVEALVGGAVYDAVPAGQLPQTYVSLGREIVQDASDKTGSGAVHNFDISIITTQPGFTVAKAVAAAVSDALRDADLALSRGRVVYLRFISAKALRVDGNVGREVRMRFRARLEDE